MFLTQSPSNTASDNLPDIQSRLDRSGADRAEIHFAFPWFVSQESIHNHQAFAFLEDRRDSGHGAALRPMRAAKPLSPLVPAQDRKP